MSDYGHSAKQHTMCTQICSLYERPGCCVENMVLMRCPRCRNNIEQTRRSAVLFYSPLPHSSFLALSLSIPRIAKTCVPLYGMRHAIENPLRPTHTHTYPTKATETSMPAAIPPCHVGPAPVLRQRMQSNVGISSVFGVLCRVLCVAVAYVWLANYPKSA